MNNVTKKSDPKLDSGRNPKSEVQLIEDIRFDDKGLVPAIVQDYNSGEVLMLAYMNRDALEKTLITGKAHYYSRSRKALWLKGETSGNTQKVKEVYYDCDADAVLLKVEQTGVACHTGEKSCFFNPIIIRGETQGKKPYDNTSVILDDVYRVILSRKDSLPKGSYVAHLFKSGLEKIISKVSEESKELMEAAAEKGRQEIIHEMADLWFHTLCLLGYKDIDLRELYEEFRKRFGISGIEEKRRRKGD